MLKCGIFNIIDVRKVSDLIDTSKENPEIHLGQLEITNQKTPDEDTMRVSKTFNVRSNHIASMN